MPPGPCPSEVITYYGAQPGWDQFREHQSSINCSQCGHAIGLDADGCPVVTVGGAIDDEPETVVAICEACSYSNRDAQLIPDRKRSEAEYRDMKSRSICQTPTGTLAERKAPQLRRAVVHAAARVAD